MVNNLKKYRLKKCITQTHIANELGICTQHYQNYEYGKRTPNVYTAIKLAKVLQTTVEELFPLSDQTEGE